MSDGAVDQLQISKSRGSRTVFLSKANERIG